MRRKLWLAYLASMLVLLSAYLQVDSLRTKDVLLAVFGASSVFATFAGIAIFRPARRRIWILVGTAQVLETIGTLFYYRPILARGVPPTPDSISSVFYLSFYVLFALVLLGLLRRRDPSRSALLDAALLALAGAVPTVLILIQPYIVTDEYHLLGRAVQIAVSFSDVILAALFLRLVAAGGLRSPAYLLLLAAVPFYVASDFVWNWFTLLGAYSPGSWGDSGWLLCFTLTGAASLHPSMARLGESSTARSPGLGRFLVFLLGVALLISPGLHLAEQLLDRDLGSLPVLALVSGISLLVLARVAGAVRSSERLRFELREQSTRMSEAAAIVDSTEDSVIGAAIDGTVRSWNPASEQLYGYTASEIIGRPIRTIAEPSRHRLVDEALEGLARGEAMARHETTGVRKDGAIIPVALTVSAIRDGAGVIVGSSTIARDISVLRAAQVEREALLGELAAQNERLIALDRMKDEFVASVSHELRTPLTSIRGYLELVRDDDTLDAEQNRMLGIVDRNADRLLRLVSDLLFVAQVDAGRLSLQTAPVDLAELARDAVEAARPRAEGGSVTLHLDASEAHLEGDRNRLAQVLDNLISNAIKFTPGGGVVTVRVGSDEGRLALEVSDTGMGIPEAEQAELFQRFFRSSGATEAAIQGTGLGLTIVKAIVESHGGTIGFRSVEGAGTTFAIELPAGVAAVAAA